MEDGKWEESSKEYSIEEINNCTGAEFKKLFYNAYFEFNGEKILLGNQ